MLNSFLRAFKKYKRVEKTKCIYKQKHLVTIDILQVGANLKIEIFMKNEIFRYVKQFFTSFPKIYMSIV